MTRSSCDPHVGLRLGHQRQRLGVGEQPPRHLPDVATTEHVAHAGHEVVDQPLLPRAPRRRAGRLRVGLGEGVQQIEHLDGADALGDVRERRAVGEIASHGDVGQQQVVLDHRDQHVGVGEADAEPVTEAADDLHAGLGVVALVALADVVEQRAEHEQVGSGDAVDELGGVGRRLPEVPVDGEAVVGVALRA